MSGVMFCELETKKVPWPRMDGPQCSFVRHKKTDNTQRLATGKLTTQTDRQSRRDGCRNIRRHGLMELRGLERSDK